MYKLSIIDKISLLLVLIGALNWGILGLTNKELIGLLFSSIPMVQRILYILVGVAGLDLMLLLFKAKIFSFKNK